MYTDPSSQKAHAHRELTSSEGIQEGIYPFQHDPNITEGSEFLDDAIRMKDQPLLKTTEKEK